MVDNEKVVVSAADYLELAIGGVDRRNIIVPLDQVSNKLRENINEEIYRSYYFYDYSRLAHTQDGGDAKGYSGNRYCRDIHLDFDGDNSLSDVRDAVNTLVKLNVPPQFIRTYYSGSKGFHLWIPDVFGFKSPEECKRTLVNLFPGIDTLPLAKNGIIRIVGSVNKKSSLYKVEIEKGDLYDFGVARIREIATTQDPYSFDAMVSLLEEWETEYGAHPLADMKVRDTPKKTVRSKRVKRNGYFGCLNSMYDLYPEDGIRHKVGLRMTSILMGPIKRSGAMTAGILDNWVAQNPTKEGVDYSKKLVDWAEGIIKKEGNLRHHDCENDPVMKEHCVGESCPIFKFRNKALKPVSMSNALNQYKAELESDEKGFNLNEAYPGVNYSFKPKDIGLVAGDTKIGKSTLLTDLGVKIKRLKWVYVTPEMDAPQMFERSVQMERGLIIDDKEGVNEVKDLVLSLNGTSDQLLEGLDHMSWITSSMGVKEIRNIVVQYDPDVLVIDPYESITEVLEDPEKVPNILRDIANQLDVIILLVHHINKSGQKELGKKKISSWMLKGHKRIQEQCNHLIGFSGERGSPIRHVYTIATRRNQDFDIYLEGDPKTFRFKLRK